MFSLVSFKHRYDSHFIYIYMLTSQQRKCTLFFSCKGCDVVERKKAVPGRLVFGCSLASFKRWCDSFTVLLSAINKECLLFFGCKCFAMMSDMIMNTLNYFVLLWGEKGPYIHTDKFSGVYWCRPTVKPTDNSLLQCKHWDFFLSFFLFSQTIQG